MDDKVGNLLDSSVSLASIVVSNEFGLDLACRAVQGSPLGSGNAFQKNSNVLNSVFGIFLFWRWIGCYTHAELLPVNLTIGLFTHDREAVCKRKTALCIL